MRELRSLMPQVLVVDMLESGRAAVGRALHKGFCLERLCVDPLDAVMGCALVTFGPLAHWA